MQGANDIRKAFLDYFGKNGHEIVSSSPLVPDNDPTLMFVNAGMVPFKNLFTGTETRDYTRATSSQKCVRAGGKHNDLDNVGYTARHHTFFEMLGNFSFGDYFKEEAISHAWNLITGDFGINPDKLTVTVYHEDDVAFDFWKKIAGFSDDRIIRIATNDNFWSMGDTGPCGPCSEIFYDHGDHIWGGPPGSPEEDGDRFVEIWNLVFMQYEQLAGGERIDLPKPSIDTGMGLERIAAVLQGTHDNYEIDTFKRIIAASVEVTGAAETEATRASHRVIADHLRACSFLIADGVLPSNEGRGYVVRRIMRRAMRHAHLLGAKDLVMDKLTPTLISEMGQAFPELPRAQKLIEETFRLEESRFRQMLDKGLRLLDDEVSNLSGDTLPGDVAFKLYDTYGFPLDLTQDALRDKNMSVDVAGFNQSMEEQRAKARAAWSGSGDTATEKVWFDIEDEFGATDFLGYASGQSEGVINALVKDGKRVDVASKGDDVLIVTNQTPFYGESGGQMGDTGTISTQNSHVAVQDTLKMVGSLHVHRSTITEGQVKVGDAVDLKINADRRQKLRANHSATHVLHEVMRRNLGEHITQKGSLVAPDRLRFDVSHPKAISAEELKIIEREVNALVRQNGEVSTRLLTYDDAIDAGAMALFGEKYGDEVRVVSMGGDTGSKKSGYSVELCGGTHVSQLGEIGLFTIVSESAVSAGVRRVEALTGAAAHDHLLQQQDLLKEAASTLKTKPEDIQERLSALLQERKTLERELTDARKKAAMGGSTSSGPAIKEINGIKFIGQVLDGVSPKDLRGIADDAKKTIGSGVVALIAVNDGKAGLLVGVTDDLKDTVNAVDLVRVGAEAVGGKGGGGRPDMAQAGGPDGAKATEALLAIENAIAA
ncbi:alanine--tRNA ligase [Kordiimonas sediminis]|uniref:Alanine--tRNA ligase n=1 Tax=Kordiimonas sediminis TaxID=1735581 RepID=A0A919E9E6_9PROT|nr:alanine--tRNA ligase [Kordiimonas sediminis]GHF27119.1 alanine--tRNA ligase [Kordiimonas sediminis]